MKEKHAKILVIAFLLALVVAIVLIFRVRGPASVQSSQPSTRGISSSMPANPQ